ncbi:MAG: hypothetical protein JJE30_06600 [Desulfuromonadales bacterium]|nr:hypothetical protein [Desulfuromonadales bacterium]
MKSLSERALTWFRSLKGERQDAIRSAELREPQTVEDAAKERHESPETGTQDTTAQGSSAAGHYMVSILLQSNAYEAEIDAQVLGSLQDNPDAAHIASPGILPGPPNRDYFIDRFMEDLRALPFAVEITDTDQKYRQEVEDYMDGLPHPDNPAESVRTMLLNIRMELAGRRPGRLCIFEVVDEKLVVAVFTFDPSAIRGGRWCTDAGPQEESDLPRFREFLCALIEAYPVRVGTLGVGVDATSAGLPHGEYRLDNGLWLHNFLTKLHKVQRQDNLDCIYINSSPWGLDKPFVYDCIEPHGSVQNTWAGRQYYDMRLVEEMRMNAGQAEKAYDRMYESKRPKDDKDDALLFLSKAIRLATDLGFEEEVAKLKENYEHIMAVYNAQFRGW